jgi:hypothetical protein
VLVGASIPFLLRPNGDSRDCLVGGAYVYVIMHSEAVPASSLSTSALYPSSLGDFKMEYQISELATACTFMCLRNMPRAFILIVIIAIVF